MRQIVLDTETTGLDWQQGHRVIEIGCIELDNRRTTGNVLHHYVNPDREIDAAAQEVHGLSADFLRDKPRFEEIVDELLGFIGDAELIIHNASFDLGFLDYELDRSGRGGPPLSRSAPVLDTLALARRLHPGQRNSLDALCKRYSVDNSRRELHGALLDAQLLADVYLAMTGGQATLSLGEASAGTDGTPGSRHRRIERSGLRLVTLAASEEDLDAHRAQLDMLDRTSETGAVWKHLETD